MKNVIALVSTAILASQVATVPAQASDEEDLAVAAAVLIGIAALAHHEDHHRDAKHFQTAQEEADFERGYRDGLHGYDYDSRHSSVAYGNGFDAGMKERGNRTAHKHRSESDGPNAPALAMRGRVGEAAARFDRNPRDIHVVGTRQLASNDFMVEVAVGHKHGVCEVGATGEIYQFNLGRM